MKNFLEILKHELGDNIKNDRLILRKWTVKVLFRIWPVLVMATNCVVPQDNFL
jgi:hypothetical protein